MSTQPPAGSTIPEVQPPKCPHCAELMPALGLYAYAVGGYRILNLWCVHCGKALHFQIFQAPAEKGGPRVQIPS
jgi:hypothetical protein